MGELARIVDQLRRGFEGGAWHGPALLEVVGKLSADEASASPIAGAHSILEIVLHVTATQDLVIRRLQGDATPLTPEEDWPVVSDASEAAWQAALQALKDSHHRLLAALDARGNGELDEPVLPGHSSLYVTLNGLVQHNLYHAGQIAVLRKG